MASVLCGVADCGRLGVHHSRYRGYVMGLAFVWKMLILYVELCLKELVLAFFPSYAQRCPKDPKEKCLTANTAS